MKRITAVTGAAVTACALALMAVGGATARTEATQIRVGASLDAAQEVPKPTGNVADARGSFSATVEKTATGGELDFDMIFRNLTGPAVAAHIHIGKPGVAGPVAAALCSPCTSPEGGKVNVNNATLQALQTGGAYVNVHTALNPNGEIRGQIEVNATFRVRMTAAREIPKPKGRNIKRAFGIFRGDVTKAGTSAQLDWKLTYTRLTGRVIGAHIHRGAPGTTGRVVVVLCGPCKSGVQKSVRLRPALVEALEDGLLYVNVHTRKNKKGEIRGQLPRVALTIS